MEKVNFDAAMINLNQSKAFDRVDDGFLESVLDSAGFGRFFCTCPLSPLLYVLALERFHRKLKVNPVLLGITLPDGNTSAKYSAYANDVSILVTSVVELEVVSREISRYELVTGAKVNYDKLLGMRLGSWKGAPLPGPLRWTDGPCKILGVCFGPDLQREKSWSEVLEAIHAAAKLWSQRNLFLKVRAKVSNSHLYPLILYRLSVLPLPSAILV